MNVKTLFFCLLWMFAAAQGVFSQPAELASNNIIWTSQSRNSSESMPCGGGDIGMNVWVENGDLLVYVARSGNFDENNALLKSGRIRIKLSPNPFGGKIFKQELHLAEGYITVSGENDGVQATVRVWADVFHPVAHFDIEANQKVKVVAAYESWRYQDRILNPRENFGNSYKWAGPKNNIARKDSINFQEDGVLVYHHNQLQTIFDLTVAQQGMDSVKDQLYNPLANLVFGGYFGGKDFKPAGTKDGIYTDTDFRGWQLESIRSQKKHQLAFYLHNLQAGNIADWKAGLNALRQENSTDGRKAFAASQKWWAAFWDRSYIMLNTADTASKAWQVGRNYQLFRYMLALNAHGQWPTKFNGGLLTVDPVFTDTAHHLTPDYRNWGGGLHTMQNQRLVYFPMIKSGDWDLMQSQLEFYLRIQKNAELRSKVYWGHEGACFTEQMENFGLPNYAEYGTKRPDYFDKGVEYNAWLEYEWDTVFEFCLMMLEEENYGGKLSKERADFIMSCLRFFDEHYQYLAKHRGSKILDADGKLVMYPGSGAETYKMATNSTATIYALYTISNKLLQYCHEQIIGRHYSMPGLDSIGAKLSANAQYVAGLMQRIPYPSFASFDGHTTIAPAKSWERINNTESPQLYPVFPWGAYGVGKPGLDTALNTWLYDTNVVKFRSHIGWKQDNIWAARLGLTDEAWRLTSLKLQNSPRRFPAFWGPGFDWVPDHNWGGSGMIGLQEMLLQTHDKKILLFPAWPKDIDVHFKLHAPYNTTVEAILKEGKISLLKVLPEVRRSDVEIMLK